MSAQTDIQDAILNNGGAYWRLEEASGNRVDSGPHGMTLTDNNTVTQTTGKVDNCAVFTRANSEKLTRASETNLQMGNADMSGWMWVWHTSVSGTRFIHGKFDGFIGEWLTFTVNGSGLGFKIYPDDGSNTTGTVVLGPSPSVDTWYFVAFGYRKADLKVWISRDGGTKTFQSGTHSGNAASNSGKFSLGDANVGDYFDGRLDEVGFVKNHELTDDQIAYLYNSGNGVNLYGETGNRRRRLLLGA